MSNPIGGVKQSSPIAAPPASNPAAPAAAPTAPTDSFEQGQRIGLNDSLEYQTPATIAARLADDNATGAGEVRLAIYVNPTTGQVIDPSNWKPCPGGISYYDSIFRAAQKAGVQLSVAVIPDHDALFSAVKNGGIAEFGQQYAEQAAALASHLHQLGVNDFELGNEPNDKAYWPINYSNKGQAAAQYMALEAPAYDAVKAAIGPDSHVVMAGLSMCDTEYLQDLYNHGLAGHTDAVNFHPYDMGSTPTEMNAKLDGMHQVMLDNGDASTPVWLTEMGSQSAGNAASESAQAQYLRTALGALPSYVSKAFWFNMRDWKSNDWGLEGVSGRQKAAYQAFQQEATRLNAQGIPPQQVDPAFSGAYATYGARLGAPAGAAYREANGNFKQVFQNGYALLSPDGMLYVRSLANQDLTAPAKAGPFDATIAAYGGELGAPTTGITAEANGNLKQVFQQGYILLAPDGKIYVRDLSNRDLTGAQPTQPQPAPPGNPVAAADPFGGLRGAYAQALGAPTSGVFQEANSNLKQTFANGYLLLGPDGTAYVRSNSGTGLWQSAAVDPSLRSAYRQHLTVLGAPSGAAYRETNGNLKQVFDGGYILQEPNGTIDVRSLSNHAL